MNSKLQTTAEGGTGLPLRVSNSMTYTIIEPPVILELVHMTEVGVSALPSREYEKSGVGPSMRPPCSGKQWGCVDALKCEDHRGLTTQGST